MQIFFVSKTVMIALCFIIWPVLQVGITYVCFKLPDKYLSPNSFLYKERKFENGGKIYEKLFKVTKWKKFLPDGGAIVLGGFKKRNLTDFSNENLEKFMTESCRGELTHLLAVFPFWIFGFFTPPYVVAIMLVYALAVNMPCVIVQRYNRPRIKKLLQRKLVRSET